MKVGHKIHPESTAAQWVVEYTSDNDDKGGSIHQHPFSDTCAISERVKSHYQRARAKRLGTTVVHGGQSQPWAPKRPTDKYWIAVHFRWGDIKGWSQGVNKPGNRAGCSLENFGKIAAARVKEHVAKGTANVRVHLFSEGNEAEFEVFKEHVPDATIHCGTHPLAWQRAFDFMTQAQELIHGPSTFTKLIGMMCDNCRERCCSTCAPDKYCTSGFRVGMCKHSTNT